MNPTFTLDIRRSAFDEDRMASRYFPFGGNGDRISLIPDILTKRRRRQLVRVLLR